MIDRKDVMPIVRTPKEIRNFSISSTEKLALYIPAGEPGLLTKKYIEWGKTQGFNARPTCKSRKEWWRLTDFKPANIRMTPQIKL